jgi:hypothetical protein
LLSCGALRALWCSRFLLSLSRLLALRGAGAGVAFAIVAFVRLFRGRTCLFAALLSGRRFRLLFLWGVFLLARLLVVLLRLTV